MQKKIERKKKPLQFQRSHFQGKSKRKEHVPFFKPEVVPALKNVLSRIGKPPSTPFVPDDFQIRALEAINRTDCLVIAPTGSGKTWIAREAILSVLERGGRAWYASPLKALSNSKWTEFGLHFDPENVGIITGDTKENTEAPIIVGTTEILRNQLYDAMHQGADLKCDLVILDEAHFLGDADRGVVWEEIMIYLPARINLLLLSATIGNGEEIAGWLESIRKKQCVVIREEKRPVPLYPLFLHPSGCLHPFLDGKKVSVPVADFIRKTDERRLRGGKIPDYIGIIKVLEKFNLLPAIFFLKSRAECDAALTARGVLPQINSTEFDDSLYDLLDRFPALSNHRQLKVLRSWGLAAHHGGQLPAWKMLVEEMMNRGHLRVIFATSTIAAGVNFPARTIVLFNSDLFNGNDFDPLSATEFSQMTGRAGRRGQDNIGFMLAVSGRFMDLNHIRRLLFQKPEDILSRLKNDFAMVLNLLLSQTPEDVRKIFERSFAAYQQNIRQHGAVSSAAKSLWADFSRHLKFLQKEGFVDETGCLTDDGCWASKLRLDYPLLVAQCLRENAFPEDNEKIFAAVVAFFAYDRDDDLNLTIKDLSPKLLLSFKKVVLAVRSLIHRLEAAGFATVKLHTSAGVAVYYWAQGHSWDSVIKATGIAEGDMATLILRTADNLRQIASLKDTYPEIAECAYRAREAILREPVLFL
jgi:ATP-dependent RNA helicase HelY